MLSFYRALGFDFIEEQHSNGQRHFAAQFGGMVFEIYPLGDANAVADKSTRLGFDVEHLDNIVEALLVSNFDIITRSTQTEWGIRAVARDPDGRAVELYQRPSVSPNDSEPA
jgi:hypothetical protein